MKLTKRLISIILLVMLVLSNVTISFAMEMANPSKAYSDVPDGTPLENAKGYRLNLTLLRDKDIIVYGDAGNVPNNRYKKGSIPIGDVNNNNITTEPYDKNTKRGCYYYRSDLGYGEYEYHGFDKEGNVYSNENFPVDSQMTRPADTYKWIYRIWDKSSTYNYGTKLDSASKYNEIAIGENLIGYSSKQINNMRSNIQNSLSWNIENSIGVFNQNDLESTSAYNYAHVYSLPSRYNNGQVLMHHYNAGKIWYADFTTTMPDSGLVKELIKPVASFENKVEGETCTIDLRGKIDDLAYYKDDLEKSKYYTRQDIVSWDFEFKDQTGKPTTEKGIRTTTTNTDKTKFSFPFKTTENQNKIYGRVTVNYANGETTISSTSDWVELPLDVILPPPIKTDDEEDTYPIEPSISAPRYMLDTEMFKLRDETDYTNVVGMPDVYINGKILSSPDATKFLNGQYLFPLMGEDRIYDYTIVYKNKLDIETQISDYVLVYTTKPSTQVKVRGTQKENRKLVAVNDTNSINSDYLLARSTMKVLKFDISGEEIYTSTKTNSTVEFLSKKPESDICIDLKVKCEVQPQYMERNDIPSGYHISNYYTYEMQVIPDYSPAVIANIWNFVLTRNEQIQMTFDQVSTDGDSISLDKSTYKLYYDDNNDGVAETLIKKGNASEFNGYKPTSLGTYNVVFYVEEKFGEPTLKQFITEEDKKYTILEQKFYVENLAPSTQLYIDVPENYPKVDIMMLNDENITRELNNKIISTRVSLMNTLIRQSLDPSVQNWDLYTYVHSQDASTTEFTGQTYPSSTTSYSKNGYSGTLERYNVTNNREKEDEGEDVDKTLSTDKPNTYTRTYNRFGQFSGKGTPLPSSVKINGYDVPQVDNEYLYTEVIDGTYKDPKTGEVTTYIAKEIEHWKAYYSLDVTEHIVKWVWYDNFTGYYKGKIYKNVKQQFNPVYRDESNKYIVYFANSSVNNISDYEYIASRANSKVILIGNNTVKNDKRIKVDLFINNSKSLDEIYNEIVEYISSDNGQERGAVVLVNTEFSISYADTDIEGDTIANKGYQIVHNPNYFDNSLGQAVNTRREFSENGYTLSSVPTKFNKTGEFSIYRKIKDMPVGHEDKSELSNDAKITLLVHRKPIAKCSLDWTFDNAKGNYKTTWVDLSYDPDLQYQDPEKTKGIREQKIKYKISGTDDWIYEIPNNLTPNKYELEYIVKDNFNVWSDPFKMTYELPTVPPAQIEAKLKTELSKFSLKGVPASENLIAYDIWTRYPYDLKLQLALYDGSTRVSPTKEITYSGATGRKTGQDIYWNDVLYNIPATLKSKNYTMKIRAVDPAVTSRYKDLDFKVTVKTPINLVPTLEKEIKADRDFNITATTSKYVNSSYSGSGVKVTLFDGTRYARTLKLNGRRSNWSLKTNQPTSIPEGTYRAKFVATLPSGEYETKYLTYEYIHNTPPTIIFAEINRGYIYENDDVSYIIIVHDVDLTPLDINIKLYSSTNTKTPIKEYNKKVLPNGSKYTPYTLKLIDDIPIGDYIIKATVTDDYNETATITQNFTAHDLWITGAVTHTEKWNENRELYNAKYPEKVRDEDTYWNGEGLVTSANTTVINENSNVVCKKVSVEIINKDYPFDEKYLQWLNADNETNEKWSLFYCDKGWTSRDNYMICRWGADEKQELTLRFTAHFSNDWIETHDVIFYIDNREDFWKLHRAW